MENISLEWLSGFYEGEGSCASPHPRGSDYSGLTRVCLDQKDLEILEAVKQRWGGQIYLSYSRAGVSRWQLSGAAAAVLLCELYPRLSQRRQHQVATALRTRGCCGCKTAWHCGKARKNPPSREGPAG